MLLCIQTFGSVQPECFLTQRWGDFSFIFSYCVSRMILMTTANKAWIFGGGGTKNSVKIFLPCPYLWLPAKTGSGCGISPGLAASPLLKQVTQAGSRDSRRRRSASPEQLPSGTEGECNVLMGGCDKRPSSPGLIVLPHEGLTEPGQFSVEWKNLNL